MFLAAVVAGYLAKRRGVESSPVGFRAGVVGTLPAVWVLAKVVDAASVLGGPQWFEVTATVFVVVFTLAFVGLVGCFSAAFGWAGGRIGGWLAERNGHPRGPVVGS